MSTDRLLALARVGACCAGHDNLGPSIGGPTWQLCRREPGHDGKHRVGMGTWIDEDEGSIPSPWTADDLAALASSAASYPGDLMEQVSALRAGGTAP